MAVDSGRERIRRAAYDLFSEQGIRAVGVDTVIAKAGVAKMTLYRNFPSKNDLVLDFLRRREERWTNQWLIGEVMRRATQPADRLLAVFDVFSDWFGRPDFEGCAFLATMLEFRDREHPVGRAAVEHLASIRAFLRDLAQAAGAADPDGLARTWHILMKGSIMAAHEGDAQAGRRAREVGELVLAAQGISAG
jgi:AcrR family transcriptional regulator